MPILKPFNCAGQCGKLLRFKDIAKPMCKDCREGADILDRNAIRLAKLTAEQALAELANPTEDLTLYNILRRNAGWGLQWHSHRREAKLKLSSPYASTLDKVRSGLFINRYYRTFTEMVEGELKWLRASAD
jgi:hypothetical protein